MQKGEETKARAVAKAGRQMNQTGYLATPLSVLLPLIDLQKGGFYHHFPSKDALALEAFKANVRQLASYLAEVARDISDPMARLRALIEASLAVAENRVVTGGCPVLNAGTEADDVSEELRALAADALEGLRSRLAAPLRDLARAGRFRDGFDVDGYSWGLLAALEGGILIRRVTKSSGAQEQVLNAIWTGLRAQLKES